MRINTGTNPKAYLTVLFFDERFNFVGEGSTTQRVQAAGNGQAPLVIDNIKAPKNGYAYIYVSNESVESVYFDNLRVVHERGRITEENHYYAYGLKIAGISSTKAGDVNEGELKNRRQYQGAFSEYDDDIQWNDFALRNYDPQIARWVQQDPYQQFASPYVALGGDPVNNIDPDGGWAAAGIFAGTTLAGRCIATTLIGAIAGGLVGGEKNGGKGMLIGAFAGLASNFIGSSAGGAIGQVSLQAVIGVSRELLNNQGIHIVNVIIHHGSELYDGNSGGKLGGHAMINFDGEKEVYGYTGWGVKSASAPDASGVREVRLKEVPLLPTKNPNDPTNWYSNIHGEEYYGDFDLIQSGFILKDGQTVPAGLTTIFSIAVDETEFNAIKGFYVSKLGTSPYPYTQFGKRCASSAYHQLQKAKIVKRTFLGSLLRAINPGALFRFFKRNKISKKTIKNFRGIESSEKGFNTYGE